MARKTPDIAETGAYRLRVSTSHLLHRAEQLAADRFTHLVGDAVTLRQFTVLAAVVEKPGLSQADLVRATGIDRSTLADMLARMEKRALLERVTSESDGRARAVTLTPLGLSTFHASIRHARAADAAILDLLPRTKAKSFQNILIKLSKLADEAAEKAERAARRQAKREAKRRARDTRLAEPRRTQRS